jgi:Esterase/lipase
MTQQQRQALDDLLRHSPFDIGGDVGEQRVVFHDMITSVPLPDDVTTTPGRLGGVPVVAIETPENDPSAVLLYFHGGGYVLGSAADSSGLAADVARRAGARAISVDYRLAPENRSPRPSTTPSPPTVPFSTTELPAPKSHSSASPQAAVWSSRRSSRSRTPACPNRRRPWSSLPGPT